MKTRDVSLIDQGRITIWLSLVVNVVLTIAAFFVGWKFGLYTMNHPEDTTPYWHIGIMVLLWIACLYYTRKALLLNVEATELYKDSSEKYSALLDDALEHMKELIHVIAELREKEEKKEEDKCDHEHGHNLP